MENNLSLQQQFAPNSICYGCGPANDKGFKIQSYVDGDKVIANFTPQSFHQAFPGVLNGGVIGTLLDCHCNWAAAWYLMQAQHLTDAPSTVTAEFTIKLLRPTPVNKTVQLIAQLKKIESDKAWIYGELIANNKVCDTCDALFVAVKEGHLAFHRW